MNAAAVSKGSGASQSISGHENHLSRMRSLAKGVARLMAATPATVRTIDSVAQRSDRRCSSPSVFITSQVEPSSA
jgi:hypothetical protein